MTSELPPADSSVPSTPDPCDPPQSQIPSAPSPQPIPTLDQLIREISAQLKGGVQPQRITVRTLLESFGVSRRGSIVNAEIKAKLDAAGLKTEPDFEFQYIDGEIGFVAGATHANLHGRDPSYRVGQLEAANKQPITVSTNATLAEATTLMLKHNYSQLPVKGNTRDVNGVVSWKSIGTRLALKVDCDSIRDYMEPPQIVSVEDSFFLALALISKYDYVLVKGSDKSITGILTASDFNDQFRKMAEPFLLIGEIEHGIRGILSGKFSDAQLQAAKAPPDERTITAITNLTFGEYVRLLSADEGWSKIDLYVDKSQFVCWLQEVGKLRNNVMHFSPDGLEKAELVKLQEFAEFLKCLRDAGAL
jgi:CBS domain-containing protein